MSHRSRCAAGRVHPIAFRLIRGRKVKGRIFMEREIQVCSQCGLARVQLSGRITEGELCELLETLAREDGWHSESPELWDLRSVRNLFLSPDQAAHLANYVSGTDGGDFAGLIAFLTNTASQNAYGVVLFQSIRSSARLCRSFRSEKRAARWLADRSRVRSQSRPGRSTSCSPPCPLAAVNVSGSSRSVLSRA